MADEDRRAERLRHWILEIHLTDPRRGFGGFYEQLLDLGSPQAQPGTSP